MPSQWATGWLDSAQASNVDTVLIDGRILKRSGKLTAIDASKLMDEASAATQAIKQRANWK
jgi:5-methylthioadenosine/S-adenosylhomocysteine deaminase